MMFRISTLPEFYSLRTILLIILICIQFAAFFVFLAKSRKSKLAATRQLYLGYALFGLTYAITRIFFLFSDFESATHGGQITQLLLIWITAAYCFTFISIIFIYYSVGKNISMYKKLIKAFTLIGLGAFVICTASLILVILNVGVDLTNNSGPQRISQYTLYISGPFLAIGILILYILVYRNSSGSAHKKAGVSILGLVIFSAGLLLDMELLSNPAFDPIRYILAPALLLTGTSIFFIMQF